MDEIQKVEIITWLHHNLTLSQLKELKVIANDIKEVQNESNRKRSEKGISKTEKQD